MDEALLLWRTLREYDTWDPWHISAHERLGEGAVVSIQFGSDESGRDVQANPQLPCWREPLSTRELELA